MHETTEAPANPTSLLQQLDARQDEVLEQLSDLNLRIEGLLKEVETWRHAADDPGQLALD